MRTKKILKKIVLIMQMSKGRTFQRDETAHGGRRVVGRKGWEPAVAVAWLEWGHLGEGNRKEAQSKGGRGVGTQSCSIWSQADVL